VAGFWVLVLAAPQAATGSMRLPAGDLSKELATLAALSVMVAGVAGRFVPDALEGVATGPVLVGVVLGTAFLHDGWRLFDEGPGSPQWRHSHHVWALIGLAAAAATAVATFDGWPSAMTRLRTRMR
jgi:hypothetical protein